MEQPQKYKHLQKKMVLKSIDFGVPQNRQRLYIVLWRDGEIERFEYPHPINETIKVGDILEPIPDPKSSPIPWFNKHVNINKKQTALQENESTNYVIGVMSDNVSHEELPEL